MRLLVLAVLLAAGWWLRTLQPLNLAAAVAWPWSGTTTVTLYFADGPYLFPVSRRMPLDAELPRRTLEALLAGPPAASRLTNPLPSGTTLRSLSVADGIAYVDLLTPGQALRNAPAAVAAIAATMTRVPGITSVALSVEGMPLTSAPTRAPLLYYPSAMGLVAAPAPASGPRAALDAFLPGPTSPELTRLPSDARLLSYDFDTTEGVVSLGFAYTPSVKSSITYLGGFSAGAVVFHVWVAPAVFRLLP